jgi:flagellar FliJ protein
MNKFKFKLQSLLNIKSQLEDSKKNDLGNATRELEIQKTALRCLHEDKERHIAEMREKTSRRVTVKKLVEYNAYIAFLNKKIFLQKENVNDAQYNVDKIREELIVIARERQMLEKLRDDKYKLFLQEHLKEEQKLNDEIISYKRESKLTGDKNDKGDPEQG